MFWEFEKGLKETPRVPFSYSFYKYEKEIKVYSVTYSHVFNEHKK